MPASLSKKCQTTSRWLTISVIGLSAFMLFVSDSVSCLSVAERPFRPLGADSSSKKKLLERKFAFGHSSMPIQAISTRPSRTALLMESSDDGDSRNDVANSKSTKEGEISARNPIQRPTSARVGGRSSSPRTTEKRNEDKPGLVKMLIPVVAVLLLLKALFGGLGSSDSSYVYYQSSVYQSQSLTPDGRIETSQKKSIRSNVPSLLEGRSKGVMDKSSTFLLRQDPDDDFDREVESMMRLQRSMMQDFFF